MSTVATLPSGCAALSFLVSDDLEHKIASFHGYQVFNNKINLIPIIINIDFNYRWGLLLTKQQQVNIRVYQVTRYMQKLPLTHLLLQLMRIGHKVLSGASRVHLIPKRAICEKTGAYDINFIDVFFFNESDESITDGN
uniref:Uncharacterized protein n=1 Tax=Glossina pallidipes TaxID=7398 RepID=A0A1B0A047_GLOPL